MAELSPMMKQYMEVKEKLPDQILFFRIGDFYEMFYDDAKLVSKELNLVLTGKLCGQEERAPMCGVPFHSCDAYISRLIKKGYKVAICEQTEDPKLAKGLVKREVIRVVTPGTVIEDQMLEEGKNNYIASCFIDESSCALAFADISTGKIMATEGTSNDLKFLKDEIARFSPSEIIFPSNSGVRSFFKREAFDACITPFEDECFDFENASVKVAKHFPDERESLGENEASALICALGGLISYLEETQKVGIERLVSFETYESDKYMRLDEIARRNLEITKTMRTGDKKGSLLWVVDKTSTAMGKRLLRKFFEQPLCNPITIEKRLNAVDELCDDAMLRMDLGDILSEIYDMERVLTRIVCGNGNPREIVSLRDTFSKLPRLKERLEDVSSRLLRENRDKIDLLQDICEEITRTLVDNPPLITRDGGYIKEGYDENLDKLRGLLTNSHEILSKMESDEREKTGIKNLKIGFNKVFGYYIEVTNSMKDQVPDNYIRKQTLTNAERFITEELKVLENDILTSRDRSIIMEAEIFQKLREKISGALERIQTTADAIAHIDVFTSFADLAVENDYCRPTITQTGEIIIEDGRHPVVEQLLKDQSFVANDCRLDKNDNQVAIITGPNMAGKSTYIRQIAIIVLLAQVGSFVPAKTATIGIVDGIFTRVGASDDLATGQSTFMVEMNEVADILKNATSESLLILDEVGRGTSTFDGMSIAKAILEYILDKKKLGAKTLFATHYHELTDMEKEFSSVKNYNTAVKKRGDDITFLRRIVKGSVDDSYGIEVSKLAGIPDSIIKRAHEILDELENGNGTAPVEAKVRQDVPSQLYFGGKSKVEEELGQVDLNTLTPIEAINLLYKLKGMLD